MHFARFPDGLTCSSQIERLTEMPIFYTRRFWDTRQDQVR